MYAAPFDYVRASSWQAAVGELKRHGPDARVLAGGQSLVPLMLLRVAEPAVLVDVNRAAERTIERTDGTLVVSSLVRASDLEHSAVVQDACPILAEAAARIGNVRVRHRGTIGGSLAHADPAAELPCLAVALDATVHALGPGGARTIPAADLFVTHLTTTLEPDEAITHVELPVLSPGEGSCFDEVARRPGDFALAEVATRVELDENGLFLRARMAVGAVADRPLDVSAALEGLRGASLDERTGAEAGRAVAESVEGSAAPGSYRLRLVSVLARRTLLAATNRARARQGAP